MIEHRHLRLVAAVVASAVVVAGCPSGMPAPADGRAGAPLPLASPSASSDASAAAAEPPPAARPERVARDPSMEAVPANLPSRPAIFRVLAMPRGNNRIEGVVRAPDGTFQLAIETGYAFDDAVMTLHPVLPAGLGAAKTRHGSFGHVGIGGVSIDLGGTVWVETFGDERNIFGSRFGAWRIDGDAPELRFAPSDAGYNGRIRWQSFDPPRAIASYEESDTEPLSDAELARLRKNQEAAAKRGLAVDYSGTRTIEHRQLVGILGTNGPSKHLFGQSKQRSPEASRPTFATSPSEAALVYWVEKRRGAAFDVSMQVRWFDWSGAQTKQASIEPIDAIADHSSLALAADGMLYVGLAGGVFPPRRPGVQSFDAAGRPAKRVELPLEGWVTANDLVLVRCGGAVWGVADEAVGNTVTVKTFRMQGGVASPPIVLGSRRFTQPQATANSRNGILMKTTCGGDRMAVAFQVKDDMKDLDSSVAVYAEWDVR